MTIVTDVNEQEGRYQMTIFVLYLCLMMGFSPMETALAPMIPENIMMEMETQEEVHILSKADGTLLATVRTMDDKIYIRYSQDVTVFEVEHGCGDLNYSFDQLVLPLSNETIEMSPLGNTIEVVRTSKEDSTETRLMIELE